MPFGEASVYAVKRMASADRRALGLRVLVMRLWPRGILKSEIDLWIPDAGPSPDLLMASKIIHWDVFATRFLAEQERLTSCRVVTYKAGHTISDDQRAQSPVEFLRHLENQYGTITLMCWEGKGKPCHRHILLTRLLNEQPPE